VKYNLFHLLKNNRLPCFNFVKLAVLRKVLESAHIKENTLSHPNLSVKFCAVAYHLRSEMGAYVFI
jgi:hypothetical protein